MRAFLRFRPLQGALPLAATLAACAVQPSDDSSSEATSTTSSALNIGHIPPIVPLRFFDSGWEKIGRAADAHAAVVATSEDRVEVWSKSEAQHLQGRVWTRAHGWGPVFDHYYYWLPNSGVSVAYMPEYLTSVPAVTGADGNVWLLPMIHFGESDDNLAENPQVAPPTRNLGAPTLAAQGGPDNGARGFVGTPAIAYVNGNLNVYVRGYDNRIYAKVVRPVCAANGFLWCDYSFNVVTDWTVLNARIDARSDPSAVVTDGRSVDLFFRGDTGQAVHYTPPRGFHVVGGLPLQNLASVSPIGSPIQGGPLAVSYGGGDWRLFAISPGRHVWWMNSTDNDFNDRIDTSCSSAAAYAAASLPPNPTSWSALHVVTVDPDGDLWHIAESTSPDTTASGAPLCCGDPHEGLCPSKGCAAPAVDIASAHGPASDVSWIDQGHAAGFDTHAHACVAPGSLGTACTSVPGKALASTCADGLVCERDTCMRPPQGYSLDAFDSAGSFERRAADLVNRVATTYQIGYFGSPPALSILRAPDALDAYYGTNIWNGHSNDALSFILATMIAGSDANASLAQQMLLTWKHPGAIGTYGDHDMQFRTLMALAYLFGPDTRFAQRHPVIAQFPGKDRVLTDQVYDYILDKLVVVHGDLQEETYLGAIPETENHILMIESTRYLNNNLINLRAWRTGRTPIRDNELGSQMSYVRARLRDPLNYDLKEYNSRPYLELVLPVLTNLVTFGPDSDVRDAARALLDYYAAKIAVSESQLRRIAPYRRRPSDFKDMDVGARWFETMTNQFVATVIPFEAAPPTISLAGQLEDPNLDSFPTCAHAVNGRVISCRGYGAEMIEYALGLYRVPLPILDVAVAKRSNIMQQFNHYTNETYYSTPTYLLGGGGHKTSPYISCDPFCSADDYGQAMPIVLFPERLLPGSITASGKVY